MRGRIAIVSIIAAPLLAAGCNSSSKVENATAANNTAVNTTAPGDDGMINYAAPNQSGNTVAP